MKRSTNKLYQHRSNQPSQANKCIFLPGIFVLLWQAPPDQNQWLQLILFSSPIVAVIILLAIAVFILFIFIWLRSRHRPAIDPDKTLPSAPAIGVDHSMTEPTPPAVGGEGTTERVADLDKTQPSPVIRGAEKEPGVKAESELQTIPSTGQRPANIAWQIAGLTDVGLKRSLNEDTMLLAEGVMPDHTPYGLYVVADGLGGHQGGEIASQLTVDAIQAYLSQQPPLPAAAPFNDWLKTAVMTANATVLARQENRDQAKKMGSTVAIALVVDGQAHVANVGDSRVYHLNTERIQQVTVDHSLVERLVQIGQLTRAEARTHKNRNVLYNTIGEKAEMEVSLYHIDVQPGDRLLLCSDGLSGLITDEEILNISLSLADPADLCRALVEAAKSAGGTDNITTIIVQMKE
jgi:serine/threonine protein phosphatase PrpC